MFYLSLNCSVHPALPFSGLVSVGEVYHDATGVKKRHREDDYESQHANDGAVKRLGGLLGSPNMIKKALWSTNTHDDLWHQVTAS